MLKDLKRGQRLAELAALVQIVAADFQRALHGAQGLGAGCRQSSVNGLQQLRLGCRAAGQAGRRKRVVEDDVGAAAAVGHRGSGPGHSVAPRLHKEQRQAGFAARRHDQPVGIGAVIDQHFTAGQAPGLAIMFGTSLDLKRREAAVAFGPGQRQADLAGDRGLQRLCRRGAGGRAGQQRRGQDGAGQQRLRVQRRAGAFHQQHGFLGSQAQAAIFLRHGQSQPAQFAHGLPGRGAAPGLA
ncbi:hypothetical protein D3C85_951400 [compost metagenome]